MFCNTTLYKAPCTGIYLSSWSLIFFVLFFLSLTYLLHVFLIVLVVTLVVKCFHLLSFTLQLVHTHVFLFFSLSRSRGLTHGDEWYFQHIPKQLTWIYGQHEQKIGVKLWWIVCWIFLKPVQHPWCINKCTRKCYRCAWFTCSSTRGKLKEKEQGKVITLLTCWSLTMFNERIFPSRHLVTWIFFSLQQGPYSIVGTRGGQSQVKLQFCSDPPPSRVVWRIGSIELNALQ